MRNFLPLFFCLVLITGCFKANVDTDANAEANIDAKAEIQAQVESFLNAHLESLVKAEVDTKVQGVGVDVRAKVADELRAQITHDLQTKIDAFLANNTQNTGMFSGGAIYILAAFVSFLILFFGTVIYLTKQAAKWKKIWRLVSNSIEHHANTDEHFEFARNLKSHISTSLEISGLKDIVDQNLKKRGLRKGKS
jgi:hypothetical protein